MPSFLTDGLVIRAQKVSEQDRLLTILTRERGIIRAFSPRALKVNSKNLSSAELLTYSRFSIYKGRDTYKISDSKPLEVFFALRGDIVSFTLAEYLCELLYYLAPVEENADSYLRLTLNCLHFLCKKTMNPRLVKAIAELKLCAFSGYMPDLSACRGCGKVKPADSYFDTVNGAVICSDCYKGEHDCVRLRPPVLAAMRHIVNESDRRLFSFSLGEQSADELAQTAELFLLVQTERKYKSLDFYKTICN